mgnify:CR=1 FL=1
MMKRIRRMLLLTAAVAALICLLSVGANAYTYPAMPDDWEDVQVTVGPVSMPLSLFPDGAYFDPEKSTMSVSEQMAYGFNVGAAIDLRGWECMGFARYVYAALFYRYPQDASIDTSLAAEYSNNYAYRNMIYEVLGTRTLSPGYDPYTLKLLFTSCQPGAVMRCGGHSMVLMAIFDDGFLIYDANFGGSNTVDVRKYSWSSFTESFGGVGIQALQMPAYYPGYSYSTGGSSSDDPPPVGEPDSYPLDTSRAGTYQVYDCSSLNVRSRPTTASSIVGSLHSGDIVYATGFYNNWAQIEFGGGYYWVFGDYVRVKNTKVTVYFDGNGAYPSFYSRTYQIGENFGAMPTAWKYGRTLLGWSDGTTTYTADSIVPDVESLELRASWCVLDFEDVNEDAWYASYVEDAYAWGLISRSNAFRPDDNATRGQMITVLGREYERETGYTIWSDGYQYFEDVEFGDYYERYVNWGKRTGIVNGTSPTEFSPGREVTREQIAEFLYRLAIYTGRTVRQAGDPSLLYRFNDWEQISGYAQAAICWAVDEGILKGDNVGNVNPQSPARRSEMITMFSRYMDYVNRTYMRYTAPEEPEQKSQDAAPAEDALPAAEPAEQAGETEDRQESGEAAGENNPDAAQPDVQPDAETPPDGT